MASPLRLSVAARGDARGVDPRVDAAWADVRATFERAEAAMSRFRDDSELTRLNRRAPVRAPVSRDLGRALAAADRAQRITGGRFDPRIVEALERIGYTGVRQGASDRRAAATPATGRVVGLDSGARSVVLEVPADLGGIGKGLALRWAADDLARRLNGDRGGTTGFLLDAGGDVVASGSLGGGEAWQVAIEDPGGGPLPLAVVAIRGRGAIATSSIRRLRWAHQGRDVHHLIDPRTGEPGGEGLLAVTVAGPDPAWAEVWSKALFLEGSSGIASLARARGLAAWWVTREGRLEMTPAARQRTIWVASEA
jgi:FAD:protein FMN transferase